MSRRITTAAGVVALVAGMSPVLLSSTGSGASPAASNTAEVVDTSATASQLAAQLAGPGVAVSNVAYSGAAAAKGTYAFTDPSVAGMSSGVILSSGNANEVVGPNS